MSPPPLRNTEVNIRMDGPMKPVSIYTCQGIFKLNIAGSGVEISKPGSGVERQRGEHRMKVRIQLENILTRLYVNTDLLTHRAGNL